MKIAHIAIAAAGVIAASAAVAGPKCTDAPKSTWMAEAAMQQKLSGEGYKIDRFKVTDGNCYEIYGKDSAGKKVEIYFNPVDGSAVKTKKE